MKKKNFFILSLFISLFIFSLILPFIFKSSLSISILSQMGVAIIICLSYHILLGQGGMLSLGHAIYVGLGSYASIHLLKVINHINNDLIHSIIWIPLIGGLTGLLFSALLGWMMIKQSGTVFAMITLGMVELVFALALMFPDIFGGESGISGNRVLNSFILGVDFSKPIQVYYLILIYTWICALFIYFLTQTPFGYLLNAVRDNPERVEFIGYNAKYIRYKALMISGFFAGIGGGLAALNFEIVTVESLSTARSGSYLLFTFLGGITFFHGAILGAIIMVLSLVLLSEWTQAWALYIGLLFIMMIMYSPSGLAGIFHHYFKNIHHFIQLIQLELKNKSQKNLKNHFELLFKYHLKNMQLILSFFLVFFNLSTFIEMIYHLRNNANITPIFSFMRLNWNVYSMNDWILIVILTIFSFILFLKTHRKFKMDLKHIQKYVDNEIKKFK